MKIYNNRMVTANKFIWVEMIDGAPMAKLFMSLWAFQKERVFTR